MTWKWLNLYLDCADFIFEIATGHGYSFPNKTSTVRPTTNSAITSSFSFFALIWRRCPVVRWDRWTPSGGLARGRGASRCCACCSCSHRVHHDQILFQLVSLRLHLSLRSLLLAHYGSSGSFLFNSVATMVDKRSLKARCNFELKSNRMALINFQFY